jgi:hypothetical protein
MRPHGEATDAAGVTHYVSGELRYVKRAGRRRKRGKGGHYETRAGCRWWCTNARIPEGSKAHPGKSVDCMACIADPPRPWALGYAGTTTGRMSYKTWMVGTPSGPQATSVFETGVRRTMIRGRRR